jgi:hypothetical protein
MEVIGKGRRPLYLDSSFSSELSEEIDLAAWRWI